MVYTCNLVSFSSYYAEPFLITFGLSANEASMSVHSIPGVVRQGTCITARFRVGQFKSGWF